MKRCPNYVGVACVNGTCPKANRDEYDERCMDVISNCKDCFYYEGCIDCVLYHTEQCLDSMEDHFQAFSP